MTDDEAAIRRLIAEHVKALRDKDVAGATAHLAPDVLSFDLAPPLANRGAETYRRNLEAWFPSWDGPLEVESIDDEITIGGDVAFSTALNRIGGAKRGDGPVALWVRVTTGLRKTDGRWRIAHEHVSVPFYMDGSIRAAVDLEP